MGRAHAVVGLDDYGIAHLVNESTAMVEIIHHVIPCDRDTCLLVVFLHAGFVLDAGHILRLKTAGDVKIRAQHRVTLQPVFIVAFQPIHAAVFRNEEGHRPVYFIVVFQTADLVVFIQTGL